MRASYHQIVVYPVLHGRFEKGCLAFQLEDADTDDNELFLPIYLKHIYVFTMLH